jgi:hypothetical protein
MRILLGLLLAVIAWPADWTTSNPEVLSKQLVLRHGQSVVKVRVRFTDDTTPTPNTQERDYFLRGADAASRLARIVYDDQQTLQGFEAITVGSVTPQAPTGQEQAIQDAQTALNRRRALETIFPISLAPAVSRWRRVRRPWTVQFSLISRIKHA